MVQTTSHSSVRPSCVGGLYEVCIGVPDIAASLDWPKGTVKSTLHRALQRLKEELPS